jgi:hypothetical protein
MVIAVTTVTVVLVVVIRIAANFMLVVRTKLAAEAIQIMH